MEISLAHRLKNDEMLEGVKLGKEYPTYNKQKEG